MNTLKIFIYKQRAALDKVQWTANYNMFLLLFVLIGLFSMGGVIGVFMPIVWLAALCVVIDLFMTAMHLAEVGK